MRELDGWCEAFGKHEQGDALIAIEMGESACREKERDVHKSVLHL